MKTLSHLLPLVLGFGYECICTEALFRSDFWEDNIAIDRDSEQLVRHQTAMQ